MHEQESTLSQPPLQAQASNQSVDQTVIKSETSLFTINKKDGEQVPFSREKVYITLKRACKGFEEYVSLDLIMQEVTKNLYDKATTKEVEDALILAAISFIEKDPAYSKVGSRLLLQKLSKEVFGNSITQETYGQHYHRSFIEGIQLGVQHEIMDPRLLEFDLELLASKLVVSRDDLIEYLGLYNLYERYFFKVEDRRIELPQMFWMRTAMGLALAEKENRNERAMEFYDLMSTLHYVPSTPTLLHAGGSHPQLSSCFLTTINDDLHHLQLLKMELHPDYQT